MNRANNRITIRLESDLDGSLGVEHAKDFTLSMLISDHIDSHVDAFRSFLLAASFPPKLVENAFNERELAKWRRIASREAQKAGDAHMRLRTAQLLFQSADDQMKMTLDLLEELQEANDMLSAANQTGDFLAELQQHEANLDDEVRARANAITGLASSMPCPHRFPNGRCTKPRCLIPNACEYDAKPGRVPTNSLSMEKLLAEAERRESAARGHPADTVVHCDNSADLYAHDSLLEPIGFIKTPKNLPRHITKWEEPTSVVMIDGDPVSRASFERASYQGEPDPNHSIADLVKPPTQTLNVAGIDTSEFGSIGDKTMHEYVTRIRELVAHPHFQNFAVEHSGARSDEVMDSVQFATKYVETNSFMALKFSERLFWRMVATYHDWAKAKGITLE